MRRKAIGFGDKAGMNIDKGLIVEASHTLPQLPENDRSVRWHGDWFHGRLYASDTEGEHTPQMPLLSSGVINEIGASGTVCMAKDNS